MLMSPDGRSLVTGSEDGSARVWDLGRPASPPVVLSASEGSVLALGLSPDGRTVKIATSQAVWSWPLATEDLVALACGVAGRKLTHPEWQGLVGNTIPYRKTCEQWPEGQR